MTVVVIAIISNMKLHVPKVFMPFHKEGQSLNLSDMSQELHYWISTSHLHASQFLFIP